VRAPSFVPYLRSALAALLVFAAAVLLPARALAEGPEGARARADAVLRQAELDDEGLDLEAALAHYDEGRALDPGSPRAPRAEARAATLRTHGEGNLVPYAKLERVRRDPALSSDPRAVDELVRAAETFPPGLVRVEVWTLAAEAYAHRLERPLEAEALLRRVIGDERADPILAQKAARDLVTLRLARGDLAGAEEAVRLAGTRADPQLARDVRRAGRRKSLHHASIALLGALLVLAARALARRGAPARVRTALASMWKVALGYAAYVGLGGALLASGYEAETSKPFLALGVVLVPVLFLARAWGAAGGSTRAARAGRATLCAAAALGAAFLVLEVIDVRLLEGFAL
jgi:hypothetical protein